MENKLEKQLYSISIISSLLDSPAKSLTAFCHLLCTHSGKIACLQARHNKNSKRRKSTRRSNLPSSSEQNQEDHKRGQYSG